jgi:AraC-like DNA-binding protein
MEPVLEVSSSGSGRRRNVLAAAASGIHEQVRRDGGDPDALLSSLYIDSKTLENGKSAIDLSAYVSLMENAARLTSNDNFGLDYGQEFTPERLGLIGMLAVTSPDLGAALSNFAELFPFHQQATQTRLARQGAYARLEYRILDGDIIDRRQDAELTMGMFANVMRHCLGRHWSPEEVHCEHLRPEAWRAHERAFNASFHFGQRTNALVFKAADLDRPMPRADMQRFARLREELISIAKDTGKLGIVDRVKSEIRSCLPDNDGSIETVADALGLPRWTLQRRLERQGWSFSGLVDRVRQELALHYLRQPFVSITEIAFMLGYSELSAFSRAFKRWEAISPQDYRRAWLRP